MSKIEVKETKQFNGQTIVKVNLTMRRPYQACSYCMFSSYDYNLHDFIGSKVAPCAMEFPPAKQNCVAGSAWVPETYLSKLQEKMNAITNN